MFELDVTPGAHSLRELVPWADCGSAGNFLISSCVSDSRACRPGDLFVAIAGSRYDGHTHAAEAVSRGAAAVVAQRKLDLPVPVLVVPDTREALGHIAQALAGHPSRSMKLIGVTGTNGKTTTTHLIASILRAAGHRAGTLGTLGYCDGLHTAPADLTTPAAPELARWLARMRANDCSYAVMEVSSHAASQRRIAGLEFAHVCLTNLRRDHLDYHGDLRDYHQAKLGVLGQLAAGGVAVLNADDAASAEQIPLLPGRVLSTAVQRPADFTASLVERFKSEQTFLLTSGTMTMPVRTAMIGDHHLYNCLMAAAAATALGIDLKTIVAGLETVRHIPGRLERIECGQPFGVFVDFAHTPDALAVALDTIREVTVGRLICVFGAGGNRDMLKRPEMGQAVESRADLAIVTTDNPRFEEPRTIAAEVLSGFARPREARWIPDRRAAIQYALSLAGPDDCVLIAGRGHEGFQIVGDQKLPLDDRDVARLYLQNMEAIHPYSALASNS